MYIHANEYQCFQTRDLVTRLCFVSFLFPKQAKVEQGKSLQRESQKQQRPTKSNKTKTKSEPYTKHQLYFYLNWICFLVTFCRSVLGSSVLDHLFYYGILVELWLRPTFEVHNNRLRGKHNLVQESTLLMCYQVTGQMLHDIWALMCSCTLYCKENVVRRGDRFPQYNKWYQPPGMCTLYCVVIRHI